MRAEVSTRVEVAVSFDGETDGHLFENTVQARQYLDDVAYHVDHGSYYAEDYPTPWSILVRKVHTIVEDWQPLDAEGGA